MRKKKRIYHRRLFLMLFLSVGLAGTGVTYAKWSGSQRMTGKFTTGILDYIYSQEAACSVQILDGDGTETGFRQEVNAIAEDAGESVNVSVSFPMPAELLLEHPDRLIKFECPLESGDSNTISKVEGGKPDFQQEPQETLTLRPSGAVLMTEEDEKEYELPEDMASAFAVPLDFEVFRETGEKDGLLMGTVYLRMTDESRELMEGLPAQLDFDEEELTEELLSLLSEDGEDAGDGEDAEDVEEEESVLLSLDARIAVTYQCVIPFYIEQGHGQMIELPVEGM